MQKEKVTMYCVMFFDGLLQDSFIESIHCDAKAAFDAVRRIKSESMCKHAWVSECEVDRSELEKALDG
jgi:hypothetical protein